MMSFGEHVVVHLMRLGHCPLVVCTLLRGALDQFFVTFRMNLTATVLSVSTKLNADKLIALRKECKILTMTTWCRREPKLRYILSGLPHMGDGICIRDIAQNYL